jgi:hypothetical protein
MQYAASLPFRGQPDRAFSLAEASLTSIGFRLTGRTPELLEAAGPGMSSTRQSPLVGASCIRLRAGQGTLAMEADLGAAHGLARFAIFFPLGLCLFLAIVLCTVLGSVLGPGLWLLIVAGVTGVNVVVADRGTAHRTEHSSADVSRAGCFTSEHGCRRCVAQRIG